MKLPTAALLAVTLCCSAAQARDKAIDTQFGMPERWAAVTDTFTAATLAATAGAGLTPQWWASFDDPVLDSLMSMGTRNNYDIATATRRVSIARTQVGTERAAYYPNVSVSAGYTYTRDAGAMHSPVAPSANTSYWDLGAQASWEIDVFGRVKDAVAAAKQNVRVSAADRAGVMLSVQSQIALTYIQLRVEQAQLVVAEAHSQRQDTALRIAEARFEAGIASMLDVDQAQQVYYSTVASIPLLEYNIHADINALSTLTGSPAGALNALLSPSHSLPDHDQPVATGVPSDLLRNRPDVIAAERTIDMYASRLGIARKEWLPSISVQASGGHTPTMPRTSSRASRGDSPWRPSSRGRSSTASPASMPFSPPKKSCSRPSSRTTSRYSTPCRRPTTPSPAITAACVTSNRSRRWWTAPLSTTRAHSTPTARASRLTSMWQTPR